MNFYDFNLKIDFNMVVPILLAMVFFLLLYKYSKTNYGVIEGYEIHSLSPVTKFSKKQKNKYDEKLEKFKNTIEKNIDKNKDKNKNHIQKIKDIAGTYSHSFNEKKKIEYIAANDALCELFDLDDKKYKKYKRYCKKRKKQNDNDNNSDNSDNSKPPPFEIIDFTGNRAEDLLFSQIVYKIKNHNEKIQTELNKLSDNVDDITYYDIENILSTIRLKYELYNKIALHYKTTYNLSSPQQDSTYKKIIDMVSMQVNDNDVKNTVIKKIKHIINLITNKLEEELGKNPDNSQWSLIEKHKALQLILSEIKKEVPKTLHINSNSKN